MPKKYPIVFYMYMPIEIHDAITREAEKRGVTRNAICRNALEEYFDRRFPSRRGPGRPSCLCPPSTHCSLCQAAGRLEAKECRLQGGD